MKEKSSEEEILCEDFSKQVNRKSLLAICEVEKFLGFELSNIEKQEIKKYTFQTVNQDRIDIANFGLNKWSIHPEREAAWMFLNKNYGTQFNNNGRYYESFNLIRSQYKRDLGYDPFPEFFKKRQEEMHHKFTIY